MIKVFRELLSFVRSESGFVGGRGGIERIIVYGVGILGIALLVFPVRMVLPDSQTASRPVLTIQVDPIVQAVQLAEQTIEETEQAVQLSQRACVMKNPDYLSFMFKGLSNYYHYFPLQEQE